MELNECERSEMGMAQFVGQGALPGANTGLILQE